MRRRASATETASTDETEVGRLRPWLIFGALSLIPLIDYGNARVSPGRRHVGPIP